MRIVVDTNIIVSSFTSRDTAERALLRLCLSGDVVPLVGNALLFEYRDVMSRSDLFGSAAVGPEDRVTLFNAFLSMARWVEIRYLWRPNLRDEGDNHLVELAVAGQAGWIVTRNIRDLTKGEIRMPQIKIGTAQAFMAEWRRTWSR